MVQGVVVGLAKGHMDPKWLKDELSKPNRSQAGLATHLGYDPSKVNRMCSGGRQVKAWEADKIREYLALTQNGREVAPISSSATHSRLATAPLSTASLPVRGTVEAGSWREATADMDYEVESLVATRAMVDSGAYALKVAGASMDQLYPIGSYVVVLPWRGGPLPYGKRVIVERERGGLRETTVKELVRGPTGEPELWPRSSHPAHQTPIPYREDDTLHLVAVVTSSIRPE